MIPLAEHLRHEFGATGPLPSTLVMKCLHHEFSAFTFGALTLRTNAGGGDANGSRVAIPVVEDGTLWLGIRPDDVLEEDRLDVVVYRLLRDDLSITLETLMQMDVAGQNREIELVGGAG